MTPYYEDEAVTIYHGDCREVLAATECWFGVDLLLTDPPYGIDVQTDNSSRGGQSFARIYGDDEPFDPAHLLPLAPKCVLWGANYYAQHLPVSPSWIVWDKRDGVLQNTNADCELAWTNLGGPARVFRHVWAGFLRASEKDAPPQHPTQKPVALMRWTIERTDAGLILDPYMGSGPVLVAAKDLGRRAIGIEIEERYCEIAARRCAQEVLAVA